MTATNAKTRPSSSSSAGTPGSGPGRHRILDDGRERAVEVEKQRAVGGIGGQRQERRGQGRRGHAGLSARRGRKVLPDHDHDVRVGRVGDGGGAGERQHGGGVTPIVRGDGGGRALLAGGVVHGRRGLGRCWRRSASAWTTRRRRSSSSTWRPGRSCWSRWPPARSRCCGGPSSWWSCALFPVGSGSWWCVVVLDVAAPPAAVVVVPPGAVVVVVVVGVVVGCGDHAGPGTHGDQDQRGDDEDHEDQDGPEQGEGSGT